MAIPGESRRTKNEETNTFNAKAAMGGKADQNEEEEKGSIKTGGVGNEYEDHEGKDEANSSIQDEGSSPSTGATPSKNRRSGNEKPTSRRDNKGAEKGTTKESKGKVDREGATGRPSGRQEQTLRGQLLEQLRHKRVRGRSKRSSSGAGGEDDDHNEDHNRNDDENDDEEEDDDGTADDVVASLEGN